MSWCLGFRKDSFDGEDNKASIHKVLYLQSRPAAMFIYEGTDVGDGLHSILCRNNVQTSQKDEDWTNAYALQVLDCVVIYRVNTKKLLDFK